MRFSLNQWTTRHWPMPDLAEGCAVAGVTGVGLWREPVAEYGLARTAKLMRDHGLTVTSLCRGGFFQQPDALDENRRAIEEAAELGTPVLCLVSGGLPEGSRDIDGARTRVADVLAEIAPTRASTASSSHWNRCTRCTRPTAAWSPPSARHSTWPPLSRPPRWAS